MFAHRLAWYHGPHQLKVFAGDGRIEGDWYEVVVQAATGQIFESCWHRDVDGVWCCYLYSDSESWQGIGNLNFSSQAAKAAACWGFKKGRKRM
jgi:hypothetical protein